MPILWISKEDWKDLKDRVKKLEERKYLFDPFSEPPGKDAIFFPGIYPMYQVPKRSIEDILYKFFDDWKLLLNHLGIKIKDVNCTQKRIIEVKEK